MGHVSGVFIPVVQYIPLVIPHPLFPTLSDPLPGIPASLIVPSSAARSLLTKFYRPWWLTRTGYAAGYYLRRPISYKPTGLGEHVHWLPRGRLTRMSIDFSKSIRFAVRCLDTGLRSATSVSMDYPPPSPISVITSRRRIHFNLINSSPR